MNERVKIVRADAGLSMREFAEKLGVSHGAISLIESGQRNVTSQMVKAICNEFGVDEHWLRNGEGEMHAPKNEDDEIAEIVAEMFHDSDPTRRKLAKFIFSLDEQDMAALKRIWSKMGSVMNDEE